MGTTQRRRVDLANAERTHLALFDQPRHGADRVLDGDSGVDAVDVIEVDEFALQPFQRGLAGGCDGGRIIVGDLAVLARHIAEFGGDEDRVTHVAKGAREQLFIVPVAVFVGCIEHCDAARARLMQHAQCIVLVGRAIAARQRRATQAEGKARESAGADRARQACVFHHGAPSCRPKQKGALRARP